MDKSFGPISVMFENNTVNNYLNYKFLFTRVLFTYSSISYHKQ